MVPVDDLKIKLFYDDADLTAMLNLYQQGVVKGFTTNPTLMRRTGVKDYAVFAQSVLAAIRDLPVSFEVFADDFDRMEQEARIIAAWGPNVYVKIPITNTRGESACALIRKLSQEGIKLNVTACLTLDQVGWMTQALSPETPAIVSVFAGRIADTGRDPMPLMQAAVQLLKPLPLTELLWASSRELYNIFQAQAVGCHIITLTPEILKKMPLIGKALDELSLDTVKMFHQDAQTAGYSL